jgi:hypothetical protein
LAIEEQAYGADHPELITTLENYAAVLRELRRYAEADELNDRAKSLASSLETAASDADQTSLNRSVPGWRPAQDTTATTTPGPPPSPSRPRP